MDPRGRLRIFSGSANPALAQEVGCYLGLDLGAVNIKRFSDGEVYVRIEESIRGCDVFLVQPTSPPVNDHLMELLIMIDACRRASARSITARTCALPSAAPQPSRLLPDAPPLTAHRIRWAPASNPRQVGGLLSALIGPLLALLCVLQVVMPYFGYARADRKTHGRESITAKLVANLITKAGAECAPGPPLHCAPTRLPAAPPVRRRCSCPLAVPACRTASSHGSAAAASTAGA